MGTIDSGVALTPACSVYNFGTQAVNYTVRMRVGSLYDQTVSVSNHPASSRLYVTFPASAVWPRGGPYAVTCSTQLVNDEYRGNDRQTGSIYAQVRDVAVRALLTPQGQVDSGAVVVPACTVYNYGSVVASYDLRLRIGTRYSEVVQVAGHQPLTARYLTFPVWTARERGNLPVSCSTAYDGDYNPTNDRQTGHVFVRVNDVACEALLGFEPAVDSGTTVLPRVTVRNPGNVPATALDIVMQIDDGYYQRLTRQLPAGAESTFVFPDWVPRLRGVRTVRCTVELTGDMVAANNRQVRSITVAVHDIGVTAIVVPGETIAAGPVNPKATVHNHGTLREPVAVCFMINSPTPYRRSIVFGNGLPLGVDTTITFGTWVASPGSYVAACSVYLPTEQVPANNKREQPFVVKQGGGIAGWLRKADLPLGPRGKAVKDGGCLASVPEIDDGIYALKGNGTCEFYSYNTVTNTWTTRESIPAIGNSGKKKTVKKGAAITTVSGVCYAVKGNNSLEFWRYNPTDRAYPWTQLADVPAGAKTIREGAGLAGVTVGDSGFVYLLKGSGTVEFYRFDIKAGIWTTMPNAPTGTSGKPFKNGSCLATDGQTMVFAIKSATNELASFEVASRNWQTRAVMPFIGSSGKKKAVKAGAGIAYTGNYLYGLKGNNTLEFWRYDPVTDNWLQFEDMPVGAGKYVKAGGALTANSDLLYALKGNGTSEFYCYVPSAAVTQQKSTGEVQTRYLRIAEELGFTVLPNPTRGQAILRLMLPEPATISLKVYDAAGRTVQSVAYGLRPGGYSVLNLPCIGLPSGVYWVQLTADEQTISRKLIIEP